MKLRIKFVKFILFLSFNVMFSEGDCLPKKIQDSEDYEVYVNEIVEEFATEMEQKYNLICTGSGGSMPYTVNEIDVIFVIYGKKTIEEARKLEIVALDTLHKKINKHQRIRPFLTESPFPISRIHISIAFLRNDHQHHEDGNLSFMFYANTKNKIFYEVWNPKIRSFETLLEESYEDAKRIVEREKPLRRNDAI